jgi:dTDP-4-dehydrorhamnose 3,5-epimerase
MGEFYAPEAQGGLRHDDPRLMLQWPLPVTEISERDTHWPLLDEIERELRRRMGPEWSSLGGTFDQDSRGT